MQQFPQHLIRYQRLMKALFKDKAGQPFEATPGQCDVFRVIFEPSIHRATVKAITQYGKSDTASMALLSVVAQRREKIIIVSPSLKQSSIIMGNIIDHIFDHPYITALLEFVDKGSLNRLRQERSKERITFRNGSEIMILTAEVKTLSKQAKALMGFGATIVLIDESALIPDDMYSKILRMVGGMKGSKLIKLGNPFLDPITNQPNHFAKSFQSNRWEKISIDWRQALAEGRISQEFLDEAKEDMSEIDWMVFYECQFPSAGASNALIPLAWIERAVNQDIPISADAKKQAGIDVARFGGDKTVYVLRKGGKILKINVTDHMDTMEVTGWVRPFLDADAPEVAGVDVVGLGAGVFDRLHELDYPVVEVNFGASPTSEEAKEKYANLRAEAYWTLREQFKPHKETGKSSISIPDDPDLKTDLAAITYGYSSEKKIKIEAKDEIKKKLGRSPDKADALALANFDLTYNEPQIVMF